MLHSIDEIQKKAGSLGYYQIFVFFTTQIPYLVVAGTMLCGAFDGIVPKNVNCTLVEEERNMSQIVSLMDFRSLIVDLGAVCGNTYIPTLLKTAVMVGGVFGATLAGYIADRFGRKPVLFGTILGLGVFNAAYAGLADQNLYLAVIILLFMGFFGGGFMVVNLIVLTETTPSQSIRLGLTTFNGWPMGMMFMALVGYLTAHWRYFHVVLACLAALCLIPCLFIHESARWLLQIGRTAEAEVIIEKTAKFNRKDLPKFSLQTKQDEDKLLKKYNYLTFFKYRKLLVLLLALAYSWLASAIISFATYFILDKLIGNRFLNFFLTALFKGITGCIPFFISKWVGRKPVLVGAVACTCAVCWASVIVYQTAGAASLALTILTVFGASCIDPIWKINHFYSSELFPVVVRNMARAVCNIGSRAGSVIGPQVAHLREVNVGLPYIIFGVISSLHLVVCIFVLPETKGRPLMDGLPGEDAQFVQQETDNTATNVQTETVIVNRISKV